MPGDERDAGVDESIGFDIDLVPGDIDFIGFDTDPVPGDIVSMGFST